MCTDETLRQAQSAAQGASQKNGAVICGRELARVAVVGKNEPVTVWEPMTESDFKEKEGLLKRFDEARNLFYEGEFVKALPLFQAIEKSDSPSVFYAEQCRYYIEHPAEWKGYWESKSK